MALAPRPTPEQLRALAELSRLQPVNTLLKDWQDRAVAALTASVDPHQIYRAQGEYAAITEFVNLVQSALEHMKRG